MMKFAFAFLFLLYVPTLPNLGSIDFYMYLVGKLFFSSTQAFSHFISIPISRQQLFKKSPVNLKIIKPRALLFKASLA